MNYLKLVNCPIKGLFPAVKNAIQWEQAGFDPNDVMRFSTQGYDDLNKERHVSVIPIKDQAKLEALKIVEEVNNNANPLDTAEIIDEATANVLKDLIASVRSQMQSV